MQISHIDNVAENTRRLVKAGKLDGSDTQIKLMPNAVIVEGGALDETSYRMIRQKTKGRGKQNKLATAVSGKNVKGAALILKETENAYGEREWAGMTAEEAGKWIGKIMRAKGNLA